MVKFSNVFGQIDITLFILKMVPLFHALHTIHELTHSLIHSQSQYRNGIGSTTEYPLFG